jgi:large subunit ribosomal protein L4
MPTIDIISPAGSKGGTVDLPAEVFDVQTNVPLIHQVVVAQLAAARAGTHSTKTRGQVRGGGRKPYRQKGTGRARQGSVRAPQFAGGGAVHGPQPRSYTQRTPKKMKAAALRGALSDRARHGRIHVLSALVDGDTPSTKSVAAFLGGLTERANLLVVLERHDEVALKSVRNLADVHVLWVDQLNTYDVLCADDVAFTQGALDAFLAGPVTAGAPMVTEAPATKQADTKAKATTEKKADAEKADAEKADAKPAAKTEKQADAASDAGAEDGGYGPDSAPAREDGSAPEGFEVKGNASSMKYHVPGSRWYDNTTAEVWFRTAEAAAAAGFAPAGGAAAQKPQEESK